ELGNERTNRYRLSSRRGTSPTAAQQGSFRTPFRRNRPEVRFPTPPLHEVEQHPLFQLLHPLERLPPGLVDVRLDGRLHPTPEFGRGRGAHLRTGGAVWSHERGRPGGVLHRQREQIELVEVALDPPEPLPAWRPPAVPGQLVPQFLLNADAG